MVVWIVLEKLVDGLNQDILINPLIFYILQLTDDLFKVGLTKEKTIDIRYKKECLPNGSKFVFAHHFF